MTQEIISSVLMREKEGKQSSTYYSSKVLKGLKLNYPPLDKLTFVVMISVTKLQPYFKSHTIEVRTKLLITKGVA